MSICAMQLAEAAKSQFSGDYSDHLALVRAYEGWKDAERDLSGYEYCWKNFLSVQSMKAIDSLRKEFFSLLMDTGLVDGNPTTCNAWSHDEHLVRAVICSGLYPGICSIVVSHFIFMGLYAFTSSSSELWCSFDLKWPIYFINVLFRWCGGKRGMILNFVCFSQIMSADLIPCTAQWEVIFTKNHGGWPGASALCKFPLPECYLFSSEMCVRGSVSLFSF